MDIDTYRGGRSHAGERSNSIDHPSEGVTMSAAGGSQTARRDTDDGSCLAGYW